VLLLLLLLLQVAAQTPATLSAAATARAAASSAHTMEPTATPHRPTSISTPVGTSSEANGTAAPATTAAGPQDRLRWWGDLARQAYEAVDGSLQGFEDVSATAGETTQGAGMSAQEAEMVKVGGVVVTSKTSIRNVQHYLLLSCVLERRVQ
jgi:hypothetical protein